MNGKEKEWEAFGQMRMFLHHIYEFKKGVRNLVLCTTGKSCAEALAGRLRRQGIDYLAQAVGEDRVNLYFGKRACLEAVRSFIDKPLNRLTPEEDFMLGAMLGYDLVGQCERFCRRKRSSAAG